MRSATHKMVGAFIVMALAIPVFSVPIDFYSDGAIGEGDVYGNVGVWGTATVDMTGGYAFDLTTYDFSTVSISGGEIGPQSLSATGNSTVNVAGGLVFGDLNAKYSSKVNISGGAVSGTLTCSDSSSVEIIGGYTDNIWARDGSTLDVKGGAINGYLHASMDSIVNIYGLDLYARDSGGAWGAGLVMGRWSDGTEFTIPLLGDTYSHITLVPEPCTASVLGVGILWLIRKRRKTGAIS